MLLRRNSRGFDWLRWKFWKNRVQSQFSREHVRWKCGLAFCRCYSNSRHKYSVNLARLCYGIQLWNRTGLTGWIMGTHRPSELGSLERLVFFHVLDELHQDQINNTLRCTLFTNIDFIFLLISKITWTTEQKQPINAWLTHNATQRNYNGGNGFQSGFRGIERPLPRKALFRLRHLLQYLFYKF